MPRVVRIAPEAKEHLRSIRHAYVIADLLNIAYFELHNPPVGGGLDGRVPVPGMMWRRGVSIRDLDDFLEIKLDDEDEDSCQACDYVLLYRRMTSDEQIRFRLSGEALIVVGVYSNVDLLKILHP